MTVKKRMFNVIRQLPLISVIFKDYFDFKKNSFFPAGHYYSPIVSVADIKKREHEIWPDKINESLNGIDLRVAEQIKLLDSFTLFYRDIPFKPEVQPGIRYNFENAFYSYTDGIILYSVIRHFKPKRIIEIGSGFSSAVMLDTNELFFNNKIDLTFIEPYPERLHSIMKVTDKASTSIIESDVQQIKLENFEKLQAGDILFVDSTHVSKTGSDVNYILFEILPSLQSGVLIHFHDIFYPFEYPKEWVLKGLNWNEDYLLKAFLMYNSKFEIKLFSEFLHTHHREAFKNLPLSYKNIGGNLWIMKK